MKLNEISIFFHVNFPDISKKVKLFESLCQVVWFNFEGKLSRRNICNFYNKNVFEKYLFVNPGSLKSNVAFICKTSSYRRLLLFSQCRRGAKIERLQWESDLHRIQNAQLHNRIPPAVTSGYHCGEQTWP